MAATPDRTDEPAEEASPGEAWVTPGRFILLALLLGCLFVLAFFLISRLPEQPSPWVMSRAKGTLRSIGSSQLAYSDLYGTYGSFTALQEEKFFAEDYAPDNIIDFYALTWEVANLSSVSEEGVIGPDIHTFTIVAWPQHPRSRALKTFGITEDQIAREYDPRHENRLEDVKTWDPIL